MKRLFLLLCLVNVIFLLWQFHVGRSTERKKVIAPTSILLVSEYERARRGADIDQLIDQNIDHWMDDGIEWMLADLNKDQRQLKPRQLPVVKKINAPKEIKKVAEPEKPKSQIHVVQKKCLEVGPFADEFSVKNWLKENALVSQQIIRKDVTIPKDYQVYFPAAKTPEESRVNKMLLKAKGLEDIWQIRSGDIKDSYSLGVFREKPRAYAFKDHLAVIGIKANIKQWDQIVPQWFARIQLEKAQAKQLELPGVKFSSCSAD